MADIRAAKRSVVDVDAAQALLASWGVDPVLVAHFKVAAVVRVGGRDLLAVTLWDHLGFARDVQVMPLVPKTTKKKNLLASFPGLTMASAPALKLLRDRKGHGFVERPVDTHVREHGVIVAVGIKRFVQQSTAVADGHKRPAVFGIASRHWSPAFAEAVPAGTTVKVFADDQAPIKHAFETRRHDLRIGFHTGGG